jgi:hypothetical protein
MNTFRVIGAGLVLLALVAAKSVLAQGYIATAQFSSQAVGDGTFDYDILLNNDPSADNSILTFWFAWTDSGLDLLPSQPTVTGLPSGWNASVQGGPYSYYGYTYEDGYSIEFTTSGYGMLPGDSLDFQFNSPDAPDALVADSPYYPGIPAATSFVYSGAPYSDAGSQFAVVPAPEPSSAGLLALGVAAGLAVRRAPIRDSIRKALSILSRAFASLR